MTALDDALRAANLSKHIVWRTQTSAKRRTLGITVNPDATVTITAPEGADPERRAQRDPRRHRPANQRHTTATIFRPATRRHPMTTTAKTLNYTDTGAISALLTGRRVVAAEMGRFDRADDQGWGDAITGKLTLDDGTIVWVAPNEGGCACSAGDYYLKSLATVDNVITSVRVTEEIDGESGEPDRSYRIYVVADAVEINAVQIDGNDGNGYYGTGYELIVTVPQPGVGTDTTGAQS